MQKTRIEWCDYTINPVKGLCRNDCWYCYAKRMYERFKWDKHIRLDLNVFNDVQKLKKPSRIFVGSMHDIFGNWIPFHWIADIIEIISRLDFQKHTFIFLTKFPQRYLEFIFPKNCWLGVTITGEENMLNKIKRWGIIDNIPDNISFISFEPLLGEVEFLVDSKINWIIIGGLTPKPRHEKEWVYGIIKHARFFDVPVFIKDNLKWPEKIREYPV